MAYMKFEELAAYALDLEDTLAGREPEGVLNCTACVSPANRMNYQLNFDGVCPRCKKVIH